MVNREHDDLREVIRSIPDFPKKGIVFRDITTLLQDPVAFQRSIDAFYMHFKDRSIHKVVGIESRGFIFGGALAYRLNAGFVPVRKPKKLPFTTFREEYQLEYGTDALEVHTDAITKGENVLIVDDLIATGGTLQATCKLVERLGGNLIALACLIELSFLKPRERFSGLEIFSLIEYDAE
jgi:adenine phosphoribosyltransferase